MVTTNNLREFIKTNDYVSLLNEVIERLNINASTDLRLATKTLPNGQIQIGFGYPHWSRIFDVILTSVP